MTGERGIISQTELSSSVTRGKRWPIAFLLAFGVLVNFLDRINLSVSRVALNVSFGVSLVGFGYLSSAYSWTYAAMQMPSGVLLDRFGIRRVVRFSILLWSIACFAAALAPGIAWFLAARLLLGISEAPTFPANAKAIGSWFPTQERSLAMAVTDAAAKFSTALGVPVLGLLLLHFGWRWSFAATGFASLFYFIVFFRLYRDPANDAPSSPERANADHSQMRRGHPGVSLAYLLRQPKVYGLALGWGAYNYTFFLLLNWLPSYLSLSLRADLLHSVLYTSVPWLLAGVSDLLIGGLLVDALIQRGWDANRVRQTVMVAGMAMGLAILGTARASSPFSAVVCISIALAGLSAMAPVAWTVPSLIAPGDTVGTIGGIANLSGQIAAISAPIITGYIVSATRSFKPAFALSTVVLFLGMAGYIILLGPIEKIPEPEDNSSND